MRLLKFSKFKSTAKRIIIDSIQMLQIKKFAEKIFHSYNFNRSNKQNDRPSFLRQILCAKVFTILVYILPNFFNYARHVHVDLIVVSSGHGLLNN